MHIARAVVLVYRALSPCGFLHAILPIARGGNPLGMLGTPSKFQNNLTLSRHSSLEGGRRMPPGESIKGLILLCQLR